MGDPPPPPFHIGNGGLSPPASAGPSADPGRRGLRRLARALRAVPGRVGHGLSRALAQEAAWEADAGSATALSAFGADWLCWPAADPQIPLDDQSGTQPSLQPKADADRRRQPISKEASDPTLDAYSSWRQESRMVQRAYRAWVCAKDRDACSAFRAYTASLDREQHAAEVYAAVTRLVGRSRPARHSCRYMRRPSGGRA